MNEQEKILNKKNNKRFVLAGGGTGGHIFPAIAIANAIKAQDPSAEILFIGAKGKMEMEKVPQAGYEIKGLDIAGFNRSSMLKNIFLPFKVIKSFFQVRNIFSSFKPDAVIGVGGYSSFPVLRFAQYKHIKNFILESNSFAGKSNIMLGKRASGIFVLNNAMKKFFPEDKLIITGNPVRKVIAENNVTKEAALHFFNLALHKKTVLVIGGSLGAKNINEAVDKHLEEFEQNNLQLIWQTGTPYFEQAKKRGEGKENVFVTEFIAQMEYAYTAADIVVSRSGAMAVAELCIIGKPTIFVPFPFAAEDHQTANAMDLVNKNAAFIVRNDNVIDDLFAKILELANHPETREKLSENIKQEAKIGADEKIAASIIASTNKN